MSLSRRVVLAAVGGSVLAGCAGPGHPAGTGTGAPATPPGRAGASAAPTRGAGARRHAIAELPVTRAEIVARYGHRRPRSWGFDAPGVLRTLPAGSPRTALTFDACGGRGGSGYDQELVAVLRRYRTPATLFLNSRWIDANPAVFRQLAADPLFEIGNHGTRHRPLSVSGRSAYGIAGTRDAGEVFDEVAGNHLKLTRLLGAPPRHFRPGTAYCDDVAARIVADLGERPVAFSVNGDGGATFTPAEVRTTVAAAPRGAIVICHMNHPEGGTAEGIAAALPGMLAAGHHFARLSG
ncbi:Peptidoglycan/xylan/chitin deacetylase, PgdA/CDA1 family [Actinacidiphila rubida]|uniref:Peptidoglycan/xylan/chitin deacetylase, PgdA/CDA1 family n=2 Tax=Actinacidiphila rubida TaxID=310780 RepID=A0A1H8QJ22_9ACTN|nr:polysaccharide deacetylase family protein [Actinacidiphila rubida]SEO54028.1 Peptidoglycan/xylan/chitin deacetylase, PgdA/CDA1 family [Actinacidiphila rubida]